MTAKHVSMVVVLVFGMFAANPLMAQYDHLNSTLFQQQFTNAGNSHIHAGLYLAPHPVPANVGHTYYTYEPLYPHEHLYAHSRTYLSFDNCNEYWGRGGGGHHGDCHGGDCGGGHHGHGGFGFGGSGALTKTTVAWQHGCNHYGFFPGSHARLQWLQYGWQMKQWGKYAHGGYGHGGDCADGNCGGGGGGIITR